MRVCVRMFGELRCLVVDNSQSLYAWCMQVLRGIANWQEVGSACSGVDSIGLSKIAPLPALFRPLSTIWSSASWKSEDIPLAHYLIGSAKAVERRRATNWIDDDVVHICHQTCRTNPGMGSISSNYP